MKSAKRESQLHVGGGICICFLRLCDPHSRTSQTTCSQEGQLPNCRIRTVDGCYTIPNAARTFDHTTRQSEWAILRPIPPKKLLLPNRSRRRRYTQPNFLRPIDDTSSPLSPIKRSSAIWPEPEVSSLSRFLSLAREFTVFIEYLPGKLK